MFGRSWVQPPDGHSGIFQSLLLYRMRSRPPRTTLLRRVDEFNISFYSSSSAHDLETVMNQELTKVLKYCAANKLSINFKNTNYMLITSPRKKTKFINHSMQYPAERVHKISSCLESEVGYTNCTHK